MRQELAQALARHSTITLTMDRYTHVALESQTQAIAGLPDLSLPSKTETLRKTGTDDGNVLAVLLAVPVQKTGDNVRQDETKTEGSETAQNSGIEGQKANCDVASNGSGGGIRTPDTRIMIPLLTFPNQRHHKSCDNARTDLAFCLAFLSKTDPDLAEAVNS